MSTLTPRATFEAWAIPSLGAAACIGFPRSERQVQWNGERGKTFMFQAAPWSGLTRLRTAAEGSFTVSY